MIYRCLMLSSCCLVLGVSIAMAQRVDEQPAPDPSERPSRIEDRREDRQERRANLREERQEDRQDRRDDATRPPRRDANQADTADLAAWLALGNHAEIELAKLAQSKSTNDDVKQFAGKMVEDHSAMLKRLQQFMPELSAAEVEQSAAPRPATDPVDENGRREVRQARRNHGPLLQIARQAAANELQMTRDLLDQYQGQDFDMGYLGQQICAHTKMLACLHAMKNQGDAAFQQTVAAGIKTTAAHMKMALTLSHQLEDKEGGTQQRQQ